MPATISPGDVVAPVVIRSLVGRHLRSQGRKLQRDHVHFLDHENIDGSHVR